MAPLERLAGRPTWLLSRASARAQTILSDAFAEEGVRGYHFRLLVALDQLGPASQADLGRSTGIDRSDVVAALDELVDRRWAERRPDPTDGRRNVVTLTRSGRAALERLDARLDLVQDEVLGPLDLTERATLVALLARLG